MPSVNVVRTSWGRKTSAGTMGVQTEGQSQVLTLYSTPPEGVYDPGVQPVQETERPGFKPITTVKGPGLRSYQFEHRIYHPRLDGNIETEVKFLRALAEQGKRVRFFNTTALAMDTWYWVRECRITEVEKGAGNRVRHATVSWTVTEATRHNPVDWTRTKFKEQPPIKIEANGPEQAATSSDPVKNDNESGAPVGTITESVAGPPAKRPGAVIGGVGSVLDWARGR